MSRKHLGIGLLSFATLLLELGIIRAFDVILDPSVGYMIVTIAVFALGLGGIYVYLFKGAYLDSPRAMPVLTLVYAATTVSLLYVLNWLPFHLDFHGNILKQLAAWSGMYLMVVLPFFLAGVILSLLFSRYADEIGGLYFADLAGAGLACLLLMVIIPILGPGGMMFFLAGLLCLAAYFLSSWSRHALYVLAPVALALISYPFIHGQYIEFADHANKRGTGDMRALGKREFVKWDPVSKVEVYAEPNGNRHFALDGGQQSSWMLPFDGDFEKPKREVAENPDGYYFGPKALVYHLKRNTPADVLILGAAVGEEPRVALTLGAKEIDAIEMVGAMVKAAKTRYAEFSGNLFNHPQVHYQQGEARTFLRATNKKYDIIQMYSNHSSSSIAQGNGALETVYLQTAEAYEEYFTHLKPDGILAMNRHFYPRMLTTAALAWHKLGRKDFYRHVLVFERFYPDTLPAVLIKMSPWTVGEVADAQAYMDRAVASQPPPEPAKPSPLITADQSYEGYFMLGQDRVEELSLMFGLYGKASLSYPVHVRFTAQDMEKPAEFLIDGAQIHDNSSVRLPLEAPWEGVQGKMVKVEVWTENKDIAKGFSLWLDVLNKPIVPTVRVLWEALFERLVYNPLKPEENMLPQAFLEQPFPKELAAQADYRLEPSVDNKPFFNMIRKTTRALSPATSKYMDGGTAMVLNWQRLPFLSKDVLGLFVVGSISILFAAIFVFLPLRWTGKRQGKWSAMPWFLLYFSCLGAGFIVIELTLIQLCTRLIGHPTYTYAAVLFALLFSAALGALASERLVGKSAWRWALPFLGVLVYGAWFLDFHQAAFAHLLQYGLPLRWLAATALIFPLGFFLGMPFPLGIGILNRVCPAGIAWAWGMNGFFTVVGGFLSLVSAFFLGFRTTLAFALAVYVLAFLACALMRGGLRKMA